jgi:hypothetical protein
LCVDCLSKKCGLSVDTLEQQLRRIGQVIVLHRDAGPCRTCQAVVSVVAIAR